jgi:hypothetical protein
MVDLYSSDHANNYVFQDDNVPVHQARIVQELMEENLIMHMDDNLNVPT